MTTEQYQLVTHVARKLLTQSMCHPTLRLLMAPILRGWGGDVSEKFYFVDRPRL